jgi:beta-aspartyl-peptidase (threonine type)
MKNLAALIVHGGSGDIPQEIHQAYVEGCHRALDAGWAVLTCGGSALDAVETAVRVLEDDPTFDAGYGSFLNAVAEVELDAIIMDGRDLNFGAVAAVQRVRHPVTLARLVMTECKHAMLVGKGAETFASEAGQPTCSPEELVIERELERWRAVQTPGKPHEWKPFGVAQDRPSGVESSGTVGAVALDANGSLAAATSTGGTFKKHPGRVGDSPLVGCGAYADNRTGAVSATGMGEALMKVVISKATCDLIAKGMSAQEAANAAIALLAERTTGHGGLIVLDRMGRVGIARNTPYLAHAYITANGEVTTGGNSK